MPSAFIQRQTLCTQEGVPLCFSLWHTEFPSLPSQLLGEPTPMPTQSPAPSEQSGKPQARPTVWGRGVRFVLWGRTNKEPLTGASGGGPETYVGRR